MIDRAKIAGVVLAGGVRQVVTAGEHQTLVDDHELHVQLGRSPLPNFDTVKH